MTIWLVVLLVGLTLFFLVVRLVKPTPLPYSQFELHRLVKEGDDTAKKLLARFKIAPFLLSLRSFISLLLVYGIDGLLSLFVGGWGAAGISILLVLVAAWATRLASVERLRRSVYERIEPRLLPLGKLQRYLFFLPPEESSETPRISSEAELLHQINTMTFLGRERQTLINAALEFSGLSVADAMSSRRSIHAVDKGEVLGPLLLDELYKTGRQTFIVIDDSLDHVVGILYLDRLTSLDLKDTLTALKAMNPEVHEIEADAPITDALAYLRSSKAPFLVVKDGDKTVGLLGMDNILRCLFETG